MSRSNQPAAVPEAICTGTLDVTFGEDQSRLRKGFGAKNMAVVRHFAFNLVRAAKDKHSIRLRRKLATWTPAYLEQLLNANMQ